MKTHLHRAGPKRVNRRHRCEFVSCPTPLGWTSLKEVELSSRFFLVFLEFGTFLHRTQPKLCFLGLKTRACFGGLITVLSRVRSQAFFCFPIAPRNISSWILLLRLRSHPAPRAGTGPRQRNLGRRSVRPLQFRQYPNLQRLDNPLRVWAEGYLQRCLPKKYTSAPKKNRELQSGDAPDASLKIREMQAV